MADESDLERTLPASPRRKQQAREEGQVPRSRELTTFSVLLAGGGALALLGGHLMGAAGGVVRQGLAFRPDAAGDTAAMLDQFGALAVDMLIAFLPFGLLVMAAALLAPMLLSGFLIAGKPLKPDFSRLDPIAGLKRIFSVRGLAELVISLAKAGLVLGVSAWILWQQKDAVLSLTGEPVEDAIVHLGQIGIICFFAIAGSLVVVACIDVPYQLWDHARKLRMSHEEMRREMKETEGDPHVKARIRSQQREAARRRMMAEVPKADVVVVNPTHFAVALSYQDGRMRAPKVVAKGAELVAARIRELAEQHKVPVLRAPALARALYRHTDLGDEIPETLYTAVAEVLAWVFQLRRWREAGGAAPHAPQDVEVPPDMDPGPRAPEDGR